MTDKTNWRRYVIVLTLPILSLAVFIILATIPLATAEKPSAQKDSTTKTDPRRPPDAAKISVGAPNVDGLALISGASGAVPSNTYVGIINLTTRNMITGTADNKGAFSATTFAPPGSSLLVKYSAEKSVIDLLWQHALVPGGDFSYMNPLPGTTIYVPDPEIEPENMQFASAGYYGGGEGPDWAGWWLSGQVTMNEEALTAPVISGHMVNVSGKIHMTSPLLNCSDPPRYAPQIGLHLLSRFGPEGQALLSDPWFNSYLFTPTGLPIEHDARAERYFVGNAQVLNLTCVSKNTMQGDFSYDFAVPAGAQNGIYQIEGWMNPGGIPLAPNVPRAIIWYHMDATGLMPLITVGKPEMPRIPWTLFANYTSNGHRGVQALQDRDSYQMVTRTILPPHRVVLPRLDARSGEPVVYQLEPGSNWLSSTDRRFPNPPGVIFNYSGGDLRAEIHGPDDYMKVIGPKPVLQSSIWTPSLPDGSVLHEGTGHTGDIYHLFTADEGFAYSFDRDGPHTIALNGHMSDIYGQEYAIDATYEVMVARVLDLDPAQLPTTPYKQGDSFAPGLHIFPPVPAEVQIKVVHMPLSDPGQAEEIVFSGRANRFGIFQPEPGSHFLFDSPGEYRVDYSAEYEAPDGTLWAGYATWGNVVEGAESLIAAHGRRGMDYNGTKIDDMPPWFRNEDLPPQKMGIENYYPYFSGDIHWGEEGAPASRRGDSIHTSVTLRDLTGPSEDIYDLLRSYFPRASKRFREPPTDFSATGLQKRLDIDEAPLFLTTSSGKDPTIYPEQIDLWGYWYGSSERPDVHVREIIGEDGMGTAYWRFNDTYGYQIGEPADGDHPGDIKWEFGGVVFRIPEKGINEYAIYSSLWVLLPEGCDDFGCARVTPPFQDATGAGINGGPIMELLGEEIDTLFLPKGVRPGDILQAGETVSFSGHVGPPLDSRVNVVITSPSGKQYGRELRANKIGWVYEPEYDFAAEETGRWTVDVTVLHDRPYIGNGVTPESHNAGTVMGTKGQYSFYVVAAEAPRLALTAPQSGFLVWPQNKIVPIKISGETPPRTKAVHYTIHDKGVVMGQGALTPDGSGRFQFVYDPVALNKDFSMLSLTAHDGRHEGLADEVTISFLASGGEARATAVTLIGEEVFAHTSASGSDYQLFLPAVQGK